MSIEQSSPPTPPAHFETQVPAALHVTVQQVDPHGNYTRETLSLNDAVLKLLRFARRHPNAICTIELREIDPVLEGCSTLHPRLRIEPLERDVCPENRCE